MLPVHRHIDFDRAGVDLLALIELVELTLLLQIFGRKRSDIHQADRLGPAQLPANLEIFLVCLLQKLILECHAVYLCVEGRVAAVI